jgi:hypothetical protein
MTIFFHQPIGQDGTKTIKRNHCLPFLLSFSLSFLLSFPLPFLLYFPLPFLLSFFLRIWFPGGERLQSFSIEKEMAFRIWDCDKKIFPWA